MSNLLVTQMINTMKKHQILPIKMMKFINNDLVMFYKIVNQLILVELLDNITVYEPEKNKIY